MPFLSQEIPAFDFQSIQANFGGKVFSGFKEIKYDDELSRSLMYGAGPRPMGKTIGQRKCTCIVTWYLSEFERFKKEVLGGRAFMLKQFAIVVKYALPGEDIIADTILGLSVTKLAGGGSSGSDPSERTSDLMPMGILWNGDDPLGESLSQAA